MCDNCLCKPVCSIFRATGGNVKACEHRVEERRGVWVRVPSSDMMTGKAYKCSRCDKMRYGSYLPNYCQCCGADMRGVKDG